MNLQRTILRVLKTAHPHLMNLASLWAEVFEEANQRVSYAGFQAELRALEEKGQVIVVIGEDRNKAKITDEGIARLAEA